VGRLLVRHCLGVHRRFTSFACCGILMAVSSPVGHISVDLLPYIVRFCLMIVCTHCNLYRHFVLALFASTLQFGFACEGTCLFAAEGCYQ